MNRKGQPGRKMAAAALTIVCCAALFSCKTLINWFSFYPDTTSMLPEEALPPEVREVFIETGDREKLHSYLLVNKGSKKLLIYFHGNTGNISHRLSDIVRLGHNDINVLAVDYRGYGRSSGKPSEEGIYLDGGAAYRFATGTLGFHDKNIYILGRSIGTTVAIHTSQGRDIAGLILVTPLTSGREMAKELGFRLFSFVAGDSFDNISRIENITCPLLVIHGTKDDLIPFSMGKAVFQKANTEKKFTVIEGAGHNDLSHPSYREYWESIRDFIGSVHDW